jgi:hypothetical protein
VKDASSVRIKSGACATPTPTSPELGLHCERRVGAAKDRRRGRGRKRRRRTADRPARPRRLPAPTMGPPPAAGMAVAPTGWQWFAAPASATSAGRNTPPAPMPTRSPLTVSSPRRPPGGGAGAARQPHCSRRSCARGLAAGAGFYRSSVRRRNALPRPRRSRARARGRAERRDCPTRNGFPFG